MELQKLEQKGGFFLGLFAVLSLLDNQIQRIKFQLPLLHKGELVVLKGLGPVPALEVAIPLGGPEVKVKLR